MKLSKLFSSIGKSCRRLGHDRVPTRSYCEKKAEPKQESDSVKAVDSNKKGLVLGVYDSKEGYILTPAAEEVNHKSGGKLCQHLSQLSGELKQGKAFILTDLMPEYSAVALSVLGPKESAYNELESLDEARENVRWCVGAGVRRLLRRGCGAIDADPAGAADAAAEAAELAAWRFDKFKSDSKAQCEVLPFGQGDKALWKQGSIRGRAQNWARYLSDMPANKMTPSDLAQEAIDALCPLGVAVAAHGRAWMAQQRMRAALAVARGSCEEPVVLDVSYAGGADSPPVLIVAKGVTFDSGGMCLKKCDSMSENRGSMAGAAVALAAIKALALLKAPINVAAIIPLCENMVSGQCMKVGDVVKALNGLSIQIENTDFEGRLMMADALVYGQILYRPSLVVDVATFTKGVLMATGGGAFGCFSNSDAAWGAVRRAGALSGDRPWRFPLWNYYHKQVTNDVSVDLRNKGSGHATPCLGAAFLKNFVCGDWVHMDITGVGKVATMAAPPYLDPRRMTGRPARTLTAFLQDIATSTKDMKQPEKAKLPASKRS